MQPVSNTGDWSRKSVGLLYLFLIAWQLGAGVMSAKEGPEPVVNFARYQSISGNYSWKIDPSDHYGGGGAAYQVKKGGQLIWSGKLPFTLHEAAVAEDGSLAGYAYTFGYRGYPRGADGSGEFIVAIIRPNGELKLKESVVRKDSRYLHAPPNPLAAGIFLNDFNDRFVVRVDDENVNERVEHWWTYQISSGKLLGKYAVSPPSETYILKARSIPGTPLTLVHYWSYDGRKAGARFALLDEGRREAWSLSLPGDYQVPGNERAEDDLRFKVRAEGAILDASRSNSFAIWSAATNERVEFSVLRNVKAEKGWTVKQTQRLPLTDSKPSPVAWPRTVELKKIATVNLGVPEASRPTVRNIIAFDIDAHENVGVLRCVDDRHYQMIVTAPDGKELLQKVGELPLSFTNVQRTTFTWLKDDRWLATVSRVGIGTQALVWELKAATGTLSELKLHDLPFVRRVARNPGGGFAALLWRSSRAYLATEVVAIDADGKERWRLVGGNSDSEDELFSPEDIVVNPEGAVVVLDGIRNSFQFFDTTRGKFQRKIRLEQTWGRKPQSLSDLSTDAAGNLVVRETEERSRWVRMRPDGQIVSRLEPKDRAGEKIDALEARLAPSGQLWVSDGIAIFRLGPDGRTDRVIGQDPDRKRLDQIAAVTVSERGEILAVDRRTGSVHVFDETGRTLRVHLPERTDIRNYFETTLAVRKDGMVLLGNSSGYPDFKPFTTFDGRDGRRGSARIELDSVEQKIYAQGNGLLVIGYKGAFLVDEQNKLVRKISRRPDQEWLLYLTHASVGEDGSFAIVSDGGGAASTYDAAGKPIGMVTFPVECKLRDLVYTGHRFVMKLADHQLGMFDAAGKPLMKLDAAEPDDDDWQMFAARQGSELWCVSTGKQAVHRYVLPHP